MAFTVEFAFFPGCHLEKWWMENDSSIRSSCGQNCVLVRGGKKGGRKQGQIKMKKMWRKVDT